MENNNVITFKNREQFLQTINTTQSIVEELGKGVEGTCYLGADNYVYKIMHPNYEQKTGVIYDINKIITTKDINLEHFCLPEQLYTIDKQLVGCKTSYISPDLFNIKNNSTSNNKIYEINFYKLLKAYYIMLKEVEKLSQEKILIYDLCYNLIFTGEKLVGIDTLGYKKIDSNPSKINSESLDEAVVSALELLLEDIITPEQYEELIEITDVEKYIKRVPKILKR